LDPYNYDPYFAPHDPIRDPEQVLNHCEKLVLLDDIIVSPPSEARRDDGTVDPSQGGADLFLRELLSNGLLEAYYTLLPPASRYPLRSMWARPWLHFGWRKFLAQKLFWQDLDLIQQTYGSNIAFYFAFCGFYSKYLIGYAAVALATLLCDAYFEGEAQHWLGPLYGIFSSVWSVFFLQQWRRRQNHLAYTWDNGLAHSARRKMVRPEFVMTLRELYNEAGIAGHMLLSFMKSGLKLDRVEHAAARNSKRAQMHRDAFDDSSLQKKLEAFDEAFNDSSLQKKLEAFDEAYFVPPSVMRWSRARSLLISGLFTLMSATVTVVCLALQDWLHDGDVRILVLSGKMTGSLIGGVTNGLLIPVIANLYRRSTLWLTDLEMHRFDQDYKKSITVKLFLFQFFNSYNSLLYIGIWMRDGTRLRRQLLSLLLTGQMLNNAQEMLMPYLHKLSQQYIETRKKLGVGHGFLAVLKINQARVLDAMQTKVQKARKLFRRKGVSKKKMDLVSKSSVREMRIDASELQEEVFRAALEQVVDTKFLPEHANQFQMDEMCELAIQFGFLAMFSSFLYMGPILCLLNNILELRIDASKLVLQTQMAEPKIMFDQNLWQGIFYFLAVTGAIVNLFLVLHVCFEACDDEDPETAMDKLFPHETDAERLTYAVYVEHGIILVQFCVLMLSARQADGVVEDKYCQDLFFITEADQYQKEQVRGSRKEHLGHIN
ncbi:hypothetical protein CYMTET_32646, partial [Cymbomonas tetramitiformis]